MTMFRTGWSIAPIRGRHAVRMMLDGQLSFCIGGVVGGREWTLFPRFIGDEPQHVAEGKT